MPSTSVSGISLVSSAYAAEPAPLPEVGVGSGQESGKSNLRQYVLAGIYALLASILVASFSVSLLSNNESRIQRAESTTKSLLGFFVGVATGYFE